MKRLKLILLFLFLVPFAVNADHSMPAFMEYEAKVKQQKATAVEVDAYYFDIEEGLITLPYGTTFKVIYEEYTNFPYSSSKNQELVAEVNYNDKFYYVRLADIEPLSNEIDFNELNKCEDKYYVYKEGAILYNGPSTIFGKLNPTVEIPKDTLLTCEYNFDDVKAASGWIYTTYNGKSGWIYVNAHCEGGYTGCPSVIPYVEPFQIVTKRTIKFGNKTLPVGTTLTVLGSGINTSYVEYKGSKAVISDELLYAMNCEDCEDEVVLEEDTKLYNIEEMYQGLFENLDENYCEKAKPLTTIPKGTKIKRQLMNTGYGSYYYATYNNSNGIISDICDEYIEEDDNNPVGNEGESNTPSGNEGENNIPAGNEEENNNTPSGNEGTNVKPETEKENQKPTSHSSIGERAKYYMIGAGIIAIIAALIIIFANRNKSDEKIDEKELDAQLDSGDNASNVEVLSDKDSNNQSDNASNVEIFDEEISNDQEDNAKENSKDENGE